VRSLVALAVLAARGDATPAGRDGRPKRAGRPRRRAPPRQCRRVGGDVGPARICRRRSRPPAGVAASRRHGSNGGGWGHRGRHLVPRVPLCARLGRSFWARPRRVGHLLRARALGGKVRRCLFRQCPPLCGGRRGRRVGRAPNKQEHVREESQGFTMEKTFRRVSPKHASNRSARGGKETSRKKELPIIALLQPRRRARRPSHH